jgi:putative flippase GtrA
LSLRPAGNQKMIQKLLDKTFWKFILVGVVNTLFGTGIMFLFYNVFHLSYWVSSASNYIFGSILSYFLNKHFTFQNKDKGPKVVVKFVINISVCYLLAYGIAKPLVRMIFSAMSTTVQENLAMLAGMCLFVLLNYFGQRFFAFKTEESSSDSDTN